MLSYLKYVDTLILEEEGRLLLIAAITDIHADGAVDKSIIK